MKPGEIRELSVEEMTRKIDDFEEELFNLRFQHKTGQLENVQTMKKVKRNIARIKTIKKEITNTISIE
ncbi:MAG: 50S ribosomal protein L29 [Desulfosarcina sp.]|nr:50S ribosomal protein L29 [Desulfobacterales bacterium]